MAADKMPKAFDKGPRIIYPRGCKELSEDLSTEETIKRLKALARAFQDMSQEGDENYKELALLMASEFYMDHTSRDVKCLIACCIADIFRIFAPEAPFTDPEHLKEIFLFLSRQLKGLEDPDAPSFKRYFYLLENLAWVKSFNICLELEDNQEIFCELFKLIFSIINENHSNKVVNFMLDMLSPLLSEADNVSQDLLDIILSNIIEPNKSTNRPAYNLAKEIIRRTSNQLEPYVQTFFNNLLVLGKTSESELSGRLFDLIYELNMISPSVLLAVLPQLEFKLKSSDKKERRSVTRLLSKMFSDQDSQLAVQNRPLWICFLGRFKDIELEVRKICVLSCQDFIMNHPELMTDVAEALKERCHDTDETIRMDVIQAIVNAGKKDFTCITEPLLQCIKDRTLDKKYNIRKEALMGLGAMYKKCTLTDDIHKVHVDRISWVKNKVLYAYYQNNVEDRILVERILNMSLVPYSLAARARMKRLLSLYCTIDEHAVKAMNELFKTQMNVRSILRNLLELHKRPNKEDKEVHQQILARVMALSRNLPDSSKALSYMKEFNDKISQDQKMRNSLIKLLSPDCSCKKAGDYVIEVLQKCGKCVAGNHFYSNVKMLLERAAPVMIDVEAMEELITYLDDAINGLREINDEIPDVVEKGIKLLYVLSHVYPGAFNSDEIYSKLMSFVKHSDDVVVDTTIQVYTNVGKQLEKQFPTIYSCLITVLQKLVKIGTPKQAKHAIYCISAIFSKKEVIFSQIFEHLQKNMDLESPNFLTSLVAIGHMAQLCPGEFATPVSKIVTGFIVKQLLMKDEGRSRSSNESWYADHLVSDETQAKVQALKMMVRWLIGMRLNEQKEGASTLRLLHTLIVHEGDLMEKGKINKAEMARLRLQAGCCMLKLAQEIVYEPHITLEYFQALAMLINDPCHQVRTRFAQKLNKGLITLKLPLQYMSIFCHAANDPAKDRRTQVKNYLVTNISKRREYLRTNSAANAKLFSVLPDYVLPYAIHLLAHDPDLKNHKDVHTLKIIKDCLWFIMEPLITKNENYSYSFYRKLIENIKQTKDAQCPNNKTNNEKLYAVCDLAFALVMTKSSSFVLKDFPAEPVLPAKLFTSPDMSYSNTKNYIPEELRQEIAKTKKFAGSYVPGADIVPIAVKSVISAAATQQRTQSTDSRTASVSPERRERLTSGSSVDTSPPPPAPAHKGKKAAAAAAAQSKPETTSVSQRNGQVVKRGRPPTKSTESSRRSTSVKSSDRDSSVESSNSSPVSKTVASNKNKKQTAASKAAASKSQGKITDYVTRGSVSPINKENKPSKANTTSSKRTIRGASTEKNVTVSTVGQSPKKGAPVRERSPTVVRPGGRRKRAASGERSSSVEASPAKVSKTDRNTTSARNRSKNQDIVPSPSSPSSASPTPKKLPNRATAKSQSKPASARQSKRMLLNGASDGDDSPSTTQSTPSPVKRRTKALAKTIEQQSDTVVKRSTRKAVR